MRTSILPGVTTTAATDRSDLRRASFLAQDGLVLSCALWALDELGILTPSLEREQTLAQLYPGLPPAGFGSLRVVLRTLALQGWLADGLAQNGQDLRIRRSRKNMGGNDDRGNLLAVDLDRSGLGSGAGASHLKPELLPRRRHLPGLAGSIGGGLLP